MSEVARDSHQNHCWNEYPAHGSPRFVGGVATIKLYIQELDI